MNRRLIMAMKIHSVTPSTIGRKPTVLRFERERPAPIKNSVTVSAWRETETIPLLRLSGTFKKEFISMAKTKNKINHGTLTFLLSDLKWNAV